MADENSQADVDSMFDAAPAPAPAAEEAGNSQADVDSMFDAAPEPTPEPAPEPEPEPAPADETPEAEPAEPAADLNNENDPTAGANAADYEDYDDLDLTDINFPEDDFDNDFGEDGENGLGKKKWIMIGAAVFVAVAGISGSAIFFLGGDAEEAHQSDRPKAILSLTIPPKSKMKPGAKKLKLAGVPKKSPANNAVQKLPEAKTAPRSAAATQQTTPPEASRPRTQAGAGLVIPSVRAIAFKGIPMMQNPRPLPGPDKQLGESLGGGVIPKVSADGRQPWQIYARPFTGETTLPRIAIIIKGLGFSRAATIAAVNHTPAEVTLAFDPYAKDVGDWVGLARTAGHETLISLPMEPDDFPTSDPGPFALQTDLQTSENLDRLRYILSVSVGNVGLLQMMGTRFATSQQALGPVLQEINTRGLLIIDNGLVKNSQIANIASTMALPRARSDVFIDQDPSRLGIMRSLAKLEAAAQKNQSAVGIAQALPSTIANIMAWSKTLAGKNLVLAPVSAVVKITGSGTLSAQPEKLATKKHPAQPKQKKPAEAPGPKSGPKSGPK